MASFAPGVVVVGLSLIDASQRSEQAVAETHIMVLRLDLQAFERMHIENPALWEDIMRNLGNHLAVRLRSVTNQLAAVASR